MSATTPEPTPRPRTFRTGRAIGAGLFLVLAMVVVGIIAKVSDYPTWFLGLLFGLILVNLLVAVLEPQEIAPRLCCQACGRSRPAKPDKACPHCGKRGFKMPLVNGVAIGLISLLLAGCGGFFLWAALTEAKGEQVIRPLIGGLALLLLSATVAAEGFGLSMASRLLRLNQMFGRRVESIDRDLRQLRLHRYLAIQIILLIFSGLIFTLATYRLMHPF